MLNRFRPKAQAHFSDHDAAIAELVGVAQRLPHDELPDADMRAALVAAIRAGKIIGLYTPIGYSKHNIELGGMPPDCDPRVTCAQWAAWVGAGLDPATEYTDLQRRVQAQARAEWEAREHAKRDQSEQGGEA